MFGQCSIIARRFTSLAKLASQRAACPALWGNENRVKGTCFGFHPEILQKTKKRFEGRARQVLLR